MAQIIAQIILVALLIHSTSAKPSPLLTEDTKPGDLGKETSREPPSKTNIRDHIVLPFYCDSESVIIGVPPAQYSRVYLLKDDDETRVSISELLKWCSHVELQSAALVRIFYKDCPLLNWLGQTKKKSTVKLAFSHLNKDTVQTQTCPSATTGPIQVPDMKCEGAFITITLSAKVLIAVRLNDWDISSFQDKMKKEGNGLTQWTDGQNIVVQVHVARKPMSKDQIVLWIQYIDKMDQLNTAKMFCAQKHLKRLRKRDVPPILVKTTPAVIPTTTSAVIATASFTRGITTLVDKTTTTEGTKTTSPGTPTPPKTIIQGVTPTTPSPGTKITSPGTSTPPKTIIQGVTPTTPSPGTKITSPGTSTPPKTIIQGVTPTTPSPGTKTTSPGTSTTRFTTPRTIILMLPKPSPEELIQDLKKIIELLLKFMGKLQRWS